MKEFTDNEKIVAKNINKEYKWMARDKSGILCAFIHKPYKDHVLNRWNSECPICEMAAFDWMFKSITWCDKKPTRISDIYNPQILDDAEREYLRTIIKPFHEEVEYVEKCGGHLIGEYIFDKEYLRIKFHDVAFVFPYFDSGKMYSRMERWKKYKLDELGITYEDENK